MTPQTYGPDEVAQMLGKSRGWVLGKVRAREFPHLRSGRTVRFTQAHLDQILALLECPTEVVDAAPIGMTHRSYARRRRRSA